MDTGQAGKLINNFINPPKRTPVSINFLPFKINKLIAIILDEDDLLYSIIRRAGYEVR